MAQYRVTETQHVTYTWLVDADSEEEAVATANDGVPDDAREDMVFNEVDAFLEGVSLKKPGQYTSFYATNENGEWSVYTEQYESVDHDDPIDGTQRRVESGFPTYEAGLARAKELLRASREESNG